MPIGVLNFLFSLTILLSSFLLFQVQPLLSKALLPLLGGVPSVWTICLVFFQSVLCLGYLYAYTLTVRIKPHHQPLLHSSLLLLSLCFLPIAIPPAEVSTSRDPLFHLLTILIGAIFLPYLFLSASNTILGRWHSYSITRSSPYKLYAISNIASLVALLSFPFLIEPNFGLAVQMQIWSGLYTAFVLLFTALSLSLIRGKTPIILEDSNCSDNSSSEIDQLGRRPLLWILQSACGTVLLLSVTNFVTTEIAPMPLLWVLPLAVYLSTFILPFLDTRWYRRRLFGRLLLLILALAAITFSSSFYSVGSVAGPELLIFGSLLLLFLVCMICHGELALSKPSAANLNRFYLYISFGGMIGGIFSGIIAPQIFIHYAEFPLALLLCLFLRVAKISSSADIPPFSVSKLYLAILSALAVIVVIADRNIPGEVHASRNFFGTLSIRFFPASDPEEVTIGLVHGKTIHGLQFVSKNKSLLPIGYYGPKSGVGLILSTKESKQPRRIGAIGLGIGSIAAYGRPGDYIRFYEINPTVISLAQTRFSFLKDSAAKIEVVTGDARLNLQQESPQGFDVLVVDAFNGDSLPLHLLTAEAMALYLSHLALDGVIVFHISNHYVDLRQPILNLANDLSLHSAIFSQTDNAAEKWRSNRYIALSRSSAAFIDPQIQKRTEPSPIKIDRSLKRWTDDYSTVIPYFY